MVCAGLSYLLPQQAGVLRIAYVAAIATKMSDTLASELGKAFGRNAFLITTLHRVPRGTEGAVSVEGTVAGIVGSIIIACLARLLRVMPGGVGSVAVCTLAAFIATTAESYIGAVFQDANHPWLTNELVNLIMTAIGAVVAVCAVQFLPVK